MSDRSPPPPTVVEGRAAMHGGGRPTAHATEGMTTVLPRPGPASLLSTSPRPQPGRVARLCGRAGHARRATDPGDSEMATRGVGFINGTAHARRMAMQVTLHLVKGRARTVRHRGGVAQRAGAAAGICTSTRMSTPDDGVQDKGKDGSGKRPCKRPASNAVACNPNPGMHLAMRLGAVDLYGLSTRPRRGWPRSNSVAPLG